jgi:dolichol-phosphate mannosyltransferase
VIASLARKRGLRQFVKFAVVGLSGTLVNLIVFTVLQRLVPNPTSTPSYDFIFTVGFMAGGVSNYYFNRIWTFRSTGHALREGAQFLTVSLIALLVSLGLIALLGGVLGHGHKMWLAATVGAIFVNFFLNKYWTFKHLN